MQNTSTDILIIGGGIAGCIAAIALSQHFHVILIDKEERPCLRIGESLAPAAWRILKQLDLLKNLSDDIYKTNIGMQSYWGSEQLYITDHLSNPDGHVMSLNRQAFECYMRSEAQKRGVKCMFGTKFEESHYYGSQWLVTTSDQQQLTASFVVDATGRQSHFARKLGIKRHQIDKLVACWAVFDHQQSNTLSTIVSCQQGWWYSAVIPDNKRVLAFHSDADIIDRKMMDDQTSFIKAAQQHSSLKKLLNGECLNIKGIVAANSSNLKQVAGPGWAAVGDAAISFDPLSSQGMFNAMALALQLSELMYDYDIIKSSNDTNAQQFEIAYTEQINTIWLHYLKHKDIFYRQEQRWKEELFWQRRH